MDTVKRYRHLGEQRDCMIVRNDGQYVLASDYDALGAELVARNATTLELTSKVNQLLATIHELQSRLNINA